MNPRFFFGGAPLPQGSLMQVKRYVSACLFFLFCCLGAASAWAQKTAIVTTSFLGGNPRRPDGVFTVLVRVSINDTELIPSAAAFRVHYPSDSLTLYEVSEGELGFPMFSLSDGGFPPAVFFDIATVGNMSNANATPVCFSITFQVNSEPSSPYTIWIEDVPGGFGLPALDLKTEIPHRFDCRGTTNITITLPTPTPGPTEEPTPEPTEEPEPTQEEPEPTPEPEETEPPPTAPTPYPTQAPYDDTTIIYNYDTNVEVDLNDLQPGAPQPQRPGESTDGAIPNPFARPGATDSAGFSGELGILYSEISRLRTTGQISARDFPTTAMTSLDLSSTATLRLLALLQKNTGVNTATLQLLAPRLFNQPSTATLALATGSTTATLALATPTATTATLALRAPDAATTATVSITPAAPPQPTPTPSVAPTPTPRPTPEYTHTPRRTRSTPAPPGERRPPPLPGSQPGSPGLGLGLGEEIRGPAPP